MTVKQDLIKDVILGMLPYLNNAQNEKLQEVLRYTLAKYEVTGNQNKEKYSEQNYIELFISAKRIEGCSEKSLKYYKATIEAMLDELQKDVKHIVTDDIRGYLTEYQEKKKLSKVSDKLNNSKSFELGESNINIDLSKDAILVCAWNKERFVNALLNIGQNVGNLFEYDKINHMATYIYPIGLTIVYNGNHSTLSGILKGEGTIQANQTYDLVPTYDYMYFDGIYFRNKMNDEKLYKVARFEIGRILAENGIR